MSFTLKLVAEVQAVMLPLTSASAWSSDSLRSFVLIDSAVQLPSAAVVVATGGLSIPKIGATDLGYQLARQFNLRVVTPRPGLVPLTMPAVAWQSLADLSGLSLPVTVSAGEGKRRIVFEEDLLFTHRGLSGPAALQISSYWEPGHSLTINLLPQQALAEELMAAKPHARKSLGNVLAAWLPSRLANTWVAQNPAWQRALADTADKTLLALADAVQRWAVSPAGTEGYAKAEVTAGGVDTRDLSQQTMESKQKGLYFIGEVVDVTGWLGGYNFQWAWSSAHACAQALGTSLKRL